MVSGRSYDIAWKKAKHFQKVFLSPDLNSWFLAGLLLGWFVNI